MQKTIFFSWQSDLPETRGVLSWALERAARNVSRDATVEEPLRVDHDTKDVAGWPEISSTILENIERSDVFVADITPINDAASRRVTPNPNVMLELGYALATGMRRLRIICVVNAAYLPNEDLKELPFDLRGGRPLVFSLANPSARGIQPAQEDEVRSTARTDLASRLERAVRGILDTVAHEQAKRIFEVTPHLITDGAGLFQVMLQLATPVPFQIKHLIKEPSGRALSGVMLSPTPVDPQGKLEVRFRGSKLSAKTDDNDLCILSGSVGHLPTAQQPVPQMHAFEVIYRIVDGQLHEIRRLQPPAH